MTSIDLVRMLKQPDSDLSDQDVLALGKMLDDYPFFQPLHYLTALKVFQTSPKRSPHYLARLALYTGDRSIIFQKFGIRQIPVKLKKPTPVVDLPQVLNPASTTNTGKNVSNETSHDKTYKSEQKSATSFLDWLDQVNKNEVMPQKPVADTGKTEANLISNKLVKGDKGLLDKFIRTRPRIGRIKKEIFSAESMARKSIEEDEEMVTETLARINAKQGHYNKAISMYEKLSLIYPDKLAYFAEEINRLKTEKKKKSN